MMRTGPALIERRPVIVGLGALILTIWFAVMVCMPDHMRASRVCFPTWCLLLLVYLADRSLRLRLLYEGLIGSAAYWILHDIPHYFHMTPFMPSSRGQFLVLLVLTGALAALPFGRRGPGVAAVSGALLGGLWVIYAAESHGFSHPMVELNRRLLPPVIFMVLGALVSERLSRRARGDTSYGGAQPALWAFIVGAALMRVTSLW